MFLSIALPSLQIEKIIDSKAKLILKNKRKKKMQNFMLIATLYKCTSYKTQYSLILRAFKRIHEVTKREREPKRQAASHLNNKATTSQLTHRQNEKCLKRGTNRMFVLIKRHRTHIRFFSFFFFLSFERYVSTHV